MITIFDILAISLLVASLIMFIIRYIREEPPILPYFLIACTCAFGNWLGEIGLVFASISLLTAAAFLFLSCIFYPKLRNMGDNPETTNKTPSKSS
ncbi:MAG: XrtV sorting system accessory protein [Pseudomonadota bacterium]